MTRWRWLAVVLAGFLAANAVLALLGAQQVAKKEELLQEQARLTLELARARRNLERLEALLPLPDADPSLIPEEFSVAMVHVGLHGCGKVAFYRRPGEMRASADVRMPDGTRPAPNSLITCGACGWVGPELETRGRR